MEGGLSKINPSNSHPSNPVQKAAMADQDPQPAKIHQSTYVLICLQTGWVKSRKLLKSRSIKEALLGVLGIRNN